MGFYFETGFFLKKNRIYKYTSVQVTDFRVEEPLRSTDDSINLKVEIKRVHSFLRITVTDLFDTEFHVYKAL